MADQIGEMSEELASWWRQRIYREQMIDAAVRKHGHLLGYARLCNRYGWPFREDEIYPREVAAIRQEFRRLSETA